MQTLAVLLHRPRCLCVPTSAGPASSCMAATLAGSLGSALVHLTCLAAFAGRLAPRRAALLARPRCIAVFALRLLPAASPTRPRGWCGPAGRVSCPLAPAPSASSGSLMGLAALKAVVDLWRRPFHWEKTPHGDRPPWSAATARPEAGTRRQRRWSASSPSRRPRWPAAGTARDEVAAALRRQCLRWRGGRGPRRRILAVVEAYGREPSRAAPLPLSSADRGTPRCPPTPCHGPVFEATRAPLQDLGGGDGG
jgi:hypothetical protein